MRPKIIFCPVVCSQDKVSVYLFEDGTAKNIVDENGVIDWGTFADVSSDLSRIYSEILKE